MALPSVTIGGNTQYMNPGIQAGTIGMPSYGGSVMMPQTFAQPTYAAPTTFAQPAMSYGTSTIMPQTTYMTQAAAPVAAAEVIQGGREYLVAGTDANRDGIPDAIERPVTTTYVSQAPAMTSYAAPTYTQAPMTTSALPTTASMVAYPQASQPFVFYPASQYSGAPAPAPAPATPTPAPAKRDVSPAKKDVKAAKKKKAGSCGFCCPAKKAPAKKK